MIWFLRSAIISTIVISGFLGVLAQSGDLKPGQKVLAGKWQLVGTAVQGQFHEVRKNEFDAVITFEAGNKYNEEVFYESNHWIIAGKWAVNAGNDTLAISGRYYTLGSSEKAPEDIILHLLWLNAGEWIGEGKEHGQPVNVYYKKLPE